MMEVARGAPIVLHGLEGHASCRTVPAPRQSDRDATNTVSSQQSQVRSVWFVSGAVALPS